MTEEKKNDREKKDDRTKTWSFIVYPESAPSNWREIIEAEHTPWIESPLHDRDTNEDGEIKKPHWHVLLMYSSNKSFVQIKELTDKLKCPIPQKCKNVKGLVRYFLHMDNPEKVQYLLKDMKSHGGADIQKHLMTITDLKKERYELIREMFLFINEKSIVEFSDLMTYAMMDRSDWFELLCDNSSHVINLYIKSMRHKNQHKNQS